jgi:hypothetical protein
MKKWSTKKPVIVLLDLMAGESAGGKKEGGERQNITTFVELRGFPYVR